MKYKLLISDLHEIHTDEDTMITYVIKVFEVKDKNYVLIRIFNGEQCVHQFFSNRLSWIDRVQSYLKGA